MTKIVHEFCGICIQRRDIAGCFSGVWGGGLRFGEESCLCIAARLRGIACWGWGRVAGSNHSPPVRRREDRGTASLIAPAVFCIALCAIARHSRAGKKTAAVKGNGCRAPCSLSGFLHHKTPCGKYLRKKYHTMVLPVTQV